MALTEAESKLIEAAHYKSVGGVRFFLKRGVSPHCADAQGRSPLHWAATLALEDMVTILLEAGANPNQQALDGTSPLHQAAAAGAINIQRALIKKGGDIHLKTNVGLTAIDFARLFKDSQSS